MTISIDDIKQVSLTVSLEGKHYAVALNDECIGLFMRMAGAFCEGGVLKLIELTPDIQITSLKEIKKHNEQK